MLVFPGLRKLISSKIQQLFNTASFDAPLTHSAIPTRAASGTTATFTRATTATVRDNEGVLRTAIAGEARFEGARRVRNLFTFTQAFDNAAWSKFRASVVANTTTAPDGTVTADSLIEDGTAANTHFIEYNTVGTVGSTEILSIYAKPNGRNWIYLQLGNTNTAYFNVATGVVGTTSGSGTVATIEASGNGFYRCSLKAVRVTSQINYFVPASADLGITYSGDGVSGLYIWGAQLEDVTAQTTQTAGEYVSVGVTSAPYYHGSFVDGVKCFPTDLAGNPLTTMLGYLAEGARTNLCLQSQTFGTTWVPSATTVSSDAVVAPDGTTTADKIVETIANANHGIAQTITFTAAAHTMSVYAKKGERDWLWMNHNATGAYKNAYFNLATGTIGTVDSGWTAAISDAGNGWYRCSITFTATAAAISVAIFNTTADGGSAAYVGDITKGTYLWGAQVELGSFASSYIATTTIATARNSDILVYSSAGNILGTAGAAYAEWTYPRAAATTTSPRIINTGAGSVPLYLASTASGDLSLYDGAVLRDGPTPTYPVTTPTKSASTWGGTAATITNAGVSVTTAFDGDMNVGSTIDIACINGTGGFELNGTIRNVRIWQRQLSASELGAITS